VLVPEVHLEAVALEGDLVSGPGPAVPGTTSSLRKDWRNAAASLPPGNWVRQLIEHHYGNQHPGQAAGCAKPRCRQLAAGH